MKIKIVLIAVTAVLVAGLAFIFWKQAHPPKRKIIFLKERAVIQPAVKKKALPAIRKASPHPKVAIVMDDFGYNMKYLDRLFAAKQPVTFSILPNLPYSKRVAELALSKGYEVILHLPLEAIDESAPAEKGTIRTDMSEKEILAMLDKDMESVPGLSGVSNHQGSKATEDKRAMRVILKRLKEKKLFFFDSLVTNKSVCGKEASLMGVPYARRDMFLDNKSSVEAIEKEVLALRRLAFRRGRAIAVCHDRKNTIAVLSRMMPELAGEGIEFARLSDMVD